MLLSEDAWENIGKIACMYRCVATMSVRSLCCVLSGVTCLMLHVTTSGPMLARVLSRSLIMHSFSSIRGAYQRVCKHALQVVHQPQAWIMSFYVDRIPCTNQMYFVVHTCMYGLRTLFRRSQRTVSKFLASL
jgi:hypothetical protein